MNLDNKDTLKSELELTVEYLSKLRNKYHSQYGLVIILASIIFLYSLAPHIVSISIISYLIALLCNPAVSLFEKKIPRTLAFCVIVLLFFGFLILIFGFLVPMILSDYSDILNKIPDILHNWYIGLQKKYPSLLLNKSNLTADRIRNTIATFAPSISFENTINIFYRVWDTLFVGYSATLSIFNILLLPMLVFYFVKDWSEVNLFILNMLPETLRDGLKSKAIKISTILNDFARGQILVALALSIFYSLALLFIGLPYAVPIGIISGLLGVIPYLGLVSGVLLAFLVQGSNDPSVFGFSKVILAYLSVLLIDGNFVTPKIVGDSMGLHPLAVILALLIGGSAFGIVGLISAIPAAAIIKFGINSLKTY